jgi:hypothetical protein
VSGAHPGPDRELVVHLTELRKRMIYVAVWFAAALGAGFAWAPRLLAFVRGRTGGLPHTRIRSYSCNELKCGLKNKKRLLYAGSRNDTHSLP